MFIGDNQILSDFSMNEASDEEKKTFLEDVYEQVGSRTVVRIMNDLTEEQLAKVSELQEKGSFAGEVAVWLEQNVEALDIRQEFTEAYKEYLDIHRAMNEQ